MKNKDKIRYLKENKIVYVAIEDLIDDLIRIRNEFGDKESITYKVTQAVEDYLDRIKEECNV